MSNTAIRIRTRDIWTVSLTLTLSGLGDSDSSYATADLAVGFIGTRKPHHHDKAETPLVGDHQSDRHNKFFPQRFVSSKAC
jgi:hypothetical protein